ncbi:MAG: HAF repeat-containing protein [Telluria sp.]
MQLHHCFSRLLLCLTATLANAAWAYPEYRVTVVGPPNSAATDINRYGVVTGDYTTASATLRAFLNRGAGVVYLGTLGGTSSNAVAINDRGQVLGEWTTATGQTRGFLYYAGTRRDIGVIPGRNTRYTDINDGGFITAYGTTPGVGPRGFLRAPDGTLTDLGTLPYDDPMTFASALNNRNQVTGASGPLTVPDQPWRAFRWAGGSMHDLGDLGATPNYGQAINACGQITGSMSMPTGTHNRVAFLYNHGRLMDLDGRPATDERDSAGTGINGLGHVVGTSNHLSGFVYRGRRMQSLNALIDPALHWDIQAPQAINNAGQIAATATRHGVQYAVRLDLIRPMLELAPDLGAEGELPNFQAEHGQH